MTESFPQKDHTKKHPMTFKELLFLCYSICTKKRHFSKSAALNAIIRIYFSQVIFSRVCDVNFKCFGFVMHAPSYAALAFLLREIFLDESYYFESTQSAPFIVDCGSNIGISVLYFKYLYPHASILCFEPQSKAFALLLKNIAVNNLENIEAHQMALSDTMGEINFYEPETGTGLMASLYQAREENGHLVKVPTKRLSYFLEHRVIPDLLKIDVEGAENRILSDLANTKRLEALQVIIEYHHGIKELDISFAEFLKVMEENSFSYNLSTSFRNLGEFQDIRIHFVKRLV